MENHHENNQPSDQSHASATSTICRLICYPIRKLRECRSKKKNETSQDRAARRAANATVAIAFFSAVTLTVAVLTYFVLSGQLDEMQADRRPWISVSVEVGALKWSNGGWNIPIRYTLKNTGRSPAMNVFVQGKIVSLFTPQQDTPFERLKKQ